METRNSSHQKKRISITCKMIVYFDIEKVNETVNIDIQHPSEGKQHAKNTS